jgi:hypothetical protein
MSFTMPRIGVITVTSEETDPNQIMDMQFPEAYAPGNPVFVLKNGQIVNSAKMQDIDWDKMDAIAQQLAEKNYEEMQNSTYTKEALIAMRKSVHRRPQILVTKDKTLHSEESLAEPKQSIDALIAAWDEALRTALPTDVFTHWDVA